MARKQRLTGKGLNKKRFARFCHKCGVPTNNYWCDDCRRERIISSHSCEMPSEEYSVAS